MQMLETGLTEKTVHAIPFLKWAGGKRWLVSRHSDIFPTKFNRYIEPFLGSGSVYFHLQPSRAILSDVNPDLINTYRALKENPRLVWRLLRKYHDEHNSSFYYKMRNSCPVIPEKRAARFIYLNRTCWNGLYRVNLNGKFNVPIGTKQNVVLDTDNFIQISSLLHTAKIRVSDFQKTVEASERGDFLFVDPPYTVKHNNNGFIKYNEELFTWEDQVRLRDCLSVALKRGVKVLVTNANHKSIRDLYKGLGKQMALRRTSTISSNSENRDIYSELIIKCY